MSQTDKAIAELNEIYARCPDIKCSKCGKCCLSPHLSLVEFLKLLDEMMHVFTKDELCTLVATQPNMAEGLQGHILCPMLSDNNECKVYNGRPISCRLEGAGVMNTILGREKSLCPEGTRTAEEEAELKPDEVEEFLNDATLANSQLVLAFDEPYFLDSLNIPCWFALILDPSITQPLFLELREIIMQRHDLSFLAEHYVNHTHLNDKLDMIDRFFKLNDENKAREALECMQMIFDGFPLTGAYYKAQSQVFIQFMKDLVTVIESDNANGES